MSTQQDINAFRAQRLANTHDPLALMANTQTPFHLDQSSLITNLQHPQPNNNFVQQPSFNTNYMPQPMQNLKDSSDPTTAMNKALALIAKAFKINTILINNNQRSSLIPRNNQIAQLDMNTSQDIKNDGNEVGQNAVQMPGIQIVENMNGLSVVSEIANHYGNGNVVTTSAEGNGNGINSNLIRCYNCRREGHYASNCTVKSKKWDAAYLQQQLQIAQEEEAGIQSTQDEFEFMTTAYAYEETERVKVNHTSEDTLQQASTSGTQSDNAPVYDSDGSTEVPKDENCYDHDIFNMLTHEVQYTNLQTELDRTKEKLENCIIKKEKEYVIERLQAQLGDLKGKSSDTQCASNTLDLVSQKLKDENVSLEFKVQNYAKDNEHLKTTYKNLFDSIKVTHAQTNSIIDSLQRQLYDTIYENAKLRAQLFDKVSEPKGTTKVDKTNALSKPVTSNSAPFIRESKVVQTVNEIAPRIFRTNPSKTSRVDNVVPNKPVKTSVRIKPITVSQPNVIHKQQANSDSNGFSSTRVNNTAKTRRPHPRSNSNTDRVPSNQCLVTANHDVCVLNYVNNMNSRADNQSANVTIRENQKKYKANAKNSKELGSKGSLASSRPSKPRTCLRWIPTGRIFAMCGKLTASSNTENKSEKSVCDNASTSNPSEPSSKGFPISLLFMHVITTRRSAYFYLSDCCSLISRSMAYVKQKDDGIFISQDKYVADILKKFDFVTVKTTSTPIETNKALLKDEKDEDVDVHLYRSMIGSLIYLIASRPDIMFVVCACARDSPFDLEAFSDSDYAGASLDRKSTTGGCQFLGKRLILWQCKKQTIVANSTTKAEYVAAANCYGQVLWIQNQMLDYSDEFGVKTGSCKFNAARQDLALLGETDLKFVDKHNMVACLERTEGNADFHQIVDFLNASTIRKGKSFSGTVTPLFQSMLSIQAVEGEGSGQPSEPQPTPSPAPPSHKSGSPPKKVGDEVVYTGEDDRVDRATTTATSLDAEQDSGNILKTQSTTIPNVPLSQGIGTGGGHTPRSDEERLKQDDLTNFIPPTPYDSPLSGGHTPGSDEGRPNINELMAICTKLSNTVLALETSKTA
ncbi:reverse transcriptase domain-containing protein [Tanacetum coccineum]